MIITICGRAGSGKGTASKALAEKLGYERISIGDMRRKVAQEMGIDILEFNKLGEQPDKSAEFDLKYEEYQKKLDPNANIILDGRMSFYCQPKSFKVFLDVDDAEAARRIMAEHRPTDRFPNLEEATKEIKERNETDALRYEKLYGVNYLDPSHFDFILDTTKRTIEETANEIITKFKEYEKNKATS